jgi:uncharacterized protein (DUF2252 family)
VAENRSREKHITDVLAEVFDDLIGADPRAFRRKFRKMAQDPFSFYRGSACLFYADMADTEDRYADERTSRVWIQGDLHAENYGTYVNDAGILVFDVNDFDEAYLGHFTWDLKRMAASLALLGFVKALSDETIAEMIEAYAAAYLEQVERFHRTGADEEFRLTLENTEGALHAVLQEARLQTRWHMLEGATRVEGHDRVFRESASARLLDDDEREEVLAAYSDYLETIPERKRQHSVSYDVKDVVGRVGFGIGSAGLPAYNLLVEGRSQALENDVILSMKQGNVAAPSRVVEDERIREHFEHSGHRTAISQRALQAHADPWLGWCELRGTGQVVQEISPYEADLSWEHLADPEEILPLLTYLGQATAKIHCVSDASSSEDLVEFETEEAIEAVIDDDLPSELAEFGASYAERVREDHGLFVDAFRNGEFP